jgi:hypothetical protein
MVMQDLQCLVELGGDATITNVTKLKEYHDAKLKQVSEVVPPPSQGTDAEKPKPTVSGEEEVHATYASSVAKAHLTIMIIFVWSLETHQLTTPPSVSFYLFSRTCVWQRGHFGAHSARSH